MNLIYKLQKNIFLVDKIIFNFLSLIFNDLLMIDYKLSYLIKKPIFDS